MTFRLFFCLTCLLYVGSFVSSSLEAGLRKYTILKNRTFYFLSDTPSEGVIFNLARSVRLAKKGIVDIRYPKYTLTEKGRVLLNVEVRSVGENIDSRKKALYQAFEYVTPLYMEFGKSSDGKFLYMPKRYARRRNVDHLVLITKPNESNKKHSGFILFRKKMMLVVDVYSSSEDLKSRVFNSMFSTIFFAEFSEESYRYYLNGVASMVEKKKSKGSDFFQKAYEKDTNNYLALYELGNSYALNEKMEESVEYYEDSLEIFSLNQNVRLDLINVYLRLKNYEDASKQLVLLKQDKNYGHWSCYFDSYLSYFFKKKREQSIKILQKCQKTYPKMPEITQFLAFLTKMKIEK